MFIYTILITFIHQHGRKLMKNNLTTLTREDYINELVIARTHSCMVASSSTVFITKRLHKLVNCNFVKNLIFLLYIASETEQLAISYDLVKNIFSKGII